MDENQIPRSWVGGQLLLARVNSTESELVMLKQVSELGLAYSYESGEVEGREIFVPWSAVSWMRPPIPADLEDTEGEAGE